MRLHASVGGHVPSQACNGAPAAPDGLVRASSNGIGGSRRRADSEGTSGTANGATRSAPMLADIEASAGSPTCKQLGGAARRTRRRPGACYARTERATAPGFS